METRTRRAVMRTMPLMSIGIIVAGCGHREKEEEQMTLDLDDAINDAVLDVWRHGGEFAVRDVVNVSFDELIVFHNGQSAEDVNRAAGFELISTKYYTSSTHLFMFRQEDVMALASTIYPDCFSFGSKDGVYGADAKVSGSGGETLVLLEG